MTCNICGNDTFEFVPFRIGTPLTVQQGNKNVPPKCRKCGSVERHRIIKTVYTNNKKQSNLHENSGLVLLAFFLIVFDCFCLFFDCFLIVFDCFGLSFA